MEDIVYYNNLYDLYGSLLTDKQRKYFEDYYFNNLSFSEMAETYKVSRNAVFKQIHIVTEKLEEYEKKLGLLDKNNKIIKLIEKVSDKKLKEELEKLL